MTQQLQLHQWSAIIAVIAFIVTATVFLGIVVYAIRMPKKKVEKLENLPWEDGKKP
jgi:hypothetical protein